MSTPKLEYIEQQSGGDDVAFSVIWMHGLGADGHDFEPIPQELSLQNGPGVRFIFPHAPQRPVTINGRMIMRAWYDILDLGRDAPQDAAGIGDSEYLIRELITQERERGIPSERIFLAGFSQGGVMALHTALRYPEPLAGVIALSCYLALADKLPTERHAANEDTPIFMAHGLFDPMLPIFFGTDSRNRLMELGYEVVWHEYPMAHSLCPDEIEHLGRWLNRRIEDLA